MTTDVNTFLASAGAPSAKFEDIGATVTGEILDAEVRDQTNFTTNEVETWPDGKPKKQVVITLQTEEIDPEIDDDDGVRRVFAKNQMLSELRKAVGKGGIEVGGKLWIKFDSEGVAKTKGFNKPKIYKVRYQPPTKTVDLGGAGEDEEAPF
jgi:hypothetical protein